MSKTRITIERVNEVQHHPDADRLDIIQCLGYKVVCGRDQFKVGDAAIYFPPDMLLSAEAVEKLGVEKYLKHAQYPHEKGKRQCRVSACRIRGVPSHGFVVGPVENLGSYGIDVTERYGGYKYEPPVRSGAGDAMQETVLFHKYTEIENIQRYPNLIPSGTLVRITEKIHGTNCRLGLINEDGWTFAAGNHKVRRAPGSGIYWEPMDLVRPLLEYLSAGRRDIVVFGEIFGPGVQDMDYGQERRSFRVFDISIDGKYISWAQLFKACDMFKIKTVPLLYIGPFEKHIVEGLTYGRTTFKGVKCGFKGREGVVVTPLIEQMVPRFGRMILKSVSADYRARKNPLDLS